MESYRFVEPENRSTSHRGDAKSQDAGALFVLESKGTWLHAGYHLITSIVAPSMLSLPYAFAGLGWILGLIFLVLGAMVTFYSYTLLCKVIEYLDSMGHRHIRFRELAGDVLGPVWNLWVVAPIQFIICFGNVLGSTVLGGQSMKIIYSIYDVNHSMKLFEFIIIFGFVMMLLSQFPSLHSLRYINFISLLLCLGYTACVVGGCIYAGLSKSASKKDYSLSGNTSNKMFSVFNSLAVIATTYGNGIIPEIQATLAPPVSGKMFKGLCICYAMVALTFFSISISGYWAFGNTSHGNIFSNMAPSNEMTLVPSWLLFAGNMFVLLQLFAVALVFSQPAYEFLEGKSSDAKRNMYAMRNLLPRLVLRCIFVAIATLISAMLPFFGDLNAVIGAFGVTPLDFVLPSLFYNVLFNPSKRSLIFWLNSTIIGVYSIVGVLGCIAAIRQIILDAASYKLFSDL